MTDIQQALSTALPGDVVLQQGNFSVEKTAALFRYAREHQLQTVFNPSPVKPAFSELWPLIDLLVVNRGEAEYFTATSDIPAEAAHYFQAAGVVSVVITLGADGVYLASPQQHIQVATPRCHVVDTTGAGDTFLAVMLASMLQRSASQPEKIDLQRAGQAAAITIGRSGTFSAFPSAAELEMLLKN